MRCTPTHHDWAGFFPSFYGGSMDDYLRDTVSYTKDVGACVRA